VIRKAVRSSTGRLNAVRYSRSICCARVGSTAVRRHSTPRGLPRATQPGAVIVNRRGSQDRRTHR
jgi:hypothetical protein